MQDLNNWNIKKEKVIKEYIGSTTTIEESLFLNKENEIKKILYILDAQLNVNGNFDYEDKINKEHFINTTNQIISLVKDKYKEREIISIYKYKIIEIYKEKSFSWIVSKIIYFFIGLMFLKLFINRYKKN